MEIKRNTYLQQLIDYMWDGQVNIQSAFALPDEDKAEQELRPFSLTGDSFPKIIVRRDIRKRWYNESGVLNIGITEFLLDKMLL